MWKIYDALISAVPEDSQVASCLAGLSWFLVRSQGVGVAMRPREGAEVVPNAGKLAGMKTRELAAGIKSWNQYEAALGLAAINSVLNAPDAVRRNCGSLLDETSDQDVFTSLLEELRGKRVAVIGHFYNLERIAGVCDLSILERRPEPGDWPDPACEYILPEQDVVIMTATTLINKTMPRLLELSRNARVVVAGPSTPLTPILLEHGIDILGGLMVEDEDRVWKTVGEGGQHQLFTSGSHMVKVSKMPQERRA
jgi:hypothetical protein